MCYTQRRINTLLLLLTDKVGKTTGEQKQKHKNADRLGSAINWCCPDFFVQHHEQKKG